MRAPFVPAALPLALLTLLALLVAAAGCDDDLGPPDHTYEARGQIVSMPSEIPGNEMHVKHESIDDFVNREGKVEGMNSMTMPFAPAEDLDLSKLSSGDKIKFTFEVRWDARPMLRVVKIKKLPADTELDFGKAKASD